jgi:hypothetical protein
MTYGDSQRLAQKGKITIKQQQEQEILEKVKHERELLRDKQGIERYFIPDPNNPIDQEIVHRVKNNIVNPIMEERRCRKILARRLSIGFRKESKTIKLDPVIETRIDTRCKLRYKTRNELVRELFCIEFNIKEHVNKA